MGAEITQLRPKDYINDPDNILTEAAGNYKTVLLVGWNQDGELDARSSTGEVAELLLLIEMFKASLMNGLYDDGDN